MRRVLTTLSCCALVLASTASAESPGERPDRVLRLEFAATARAQIAIWIERADGTFVDTLRLTQSVSYRGIGNRPGATLMNSGFRWPYGRREGVLPVWAHRRAGAPDAAQFPRVIFQDRTSEGYASKTSNDASRDDYFCLSFMQDTTRREALDAVSCASPFNSDKGRYVTEPDVARGYAEPWEDPDGESFMRPLDLHSLYPPRRDARRCSSVGCADHADVARFSADARTVMPAIDAITMATPPGDTAQRIQVNVPDAWPHGEYVAFIEVNVEGDYNEQWNDTTHPTPVGPSGTWDTWAINYGYPYRGQPSVVYSVPFSLNGPGTYETAEPVGYSDVGGETGDMRPMGGGAITDDPVTAPGSGADRLRALDDGSRFRVEVIATNVCSSPDPPPECGAECGLTRPCADGFACGPESTCVGYCDLEMPPEAVVDLTAEVHEDVKMAHRVVRLRFVVPESERGVESYDVRVGTDPIVDEESFMRALPAMGPSIDSVGLSVPTDGVPGDVIDVEVGGLAPETSYFVAVRAADGCNQSGPFEVAEVTTQEIHFTTVSPCFVATAAWGSPLAEDVGTLRRFRDRHLMTNAPGRALVDAYYALGPHAADAIRESELLRAGARSAISPWVTLAELLE